MIRNKSLLVLLLFSIVGSTVLTVIPVQPSYSSSAQETIDEDQQGEPTDNEEPVDEPEPEPIDGPNDVETNPPSQDLADQPVPPGPTTERHACPGDFWVNYPYRPAFCVPYPKGCPDMDNPNCPHSLAPVEPPADVQLPAEEQPQDDEPSPDIRSEQGQPDVQPPQADEDPPDEGGGVETNDN